jgi:hypothetical protein
MSRIKQHPQSQQLEQALLKLGLRMRRQHLYRGLIQLTYTAFAGLVVFFLVDWLTSMPYAVRLCAWVAALVYGIVWFIRNPLRASRQPVDVQQIGLLIEQRFPELHSRMISTLQFQSEDGVGKAMSVNLVEGVLDQTFLQLPNIKMDSIVDMDRLRRALKYLAISILLIGAAGGIGQEYFGAFIKRLFIPSVEYPTKTQIVEVNAPEVVPIDNPFSMHIRASGRIPPVGHVEVRNEEGFASTIELSLDAGANDLFTVEMPGLSEPVTYTIYLGDAQHGPVSLTPVARPHIKTLNLEVVPPAYTGEPREQLQTGSARVIHGSVLTLRIEPTQRLKTLELVSPDNSTTLPAMTRADNGAWETTLPAKNSLAYTVAMVAETGLSNATLPHYRITVRPDKPPVIRITKPSLVNELAAISKLPLAFEVTDDFQLGNVTIFYEILQSSLLGEVSDKPRQGTVFKAIPVTGKKLQFNGFWDNAIAQPEPGQQIRVWIEAQDKCVDGAHLTRSNDFTVTVITAQEYRTMLVQRLQETVDPAEELILDVRSSKRKLRKIDE